MIWRRSLQTRFRPDRLPMMTSLGLCLLAAKAEGLHHRRWRL